MTTLADIASDIADDLDDTTGEYSDAITKAVQGAQRYCERSLFYFNETRDETFVTVDGQEWYGLADNAHIPTLVRIHALYSEDSGGQRLPLVRSAPEEIESIADSSAANGEPYWWTYYNQKIRLYPIPTATVYTIRLQLGPYRLTALSASSDTNAWLTEAYDMIKARAKYIIYKNTIKDASLAAEALNDYQDQYSELKAETSRRNGSGYIRPTSF
jgi:hypothetical protein